MLAILRALPLLVQVGIGLAIVGAAVGGYAYWHHQVYESGYDDAIKDVAARNAAAAQDVKAAVSKPRQCRDDGGTWDVSRGVCRQD